MPSIAEIKEQEITQTPLLLFDCSLASGQSERWSTHAVEVGGVSYAARVVRHNLFEMRSGADSGIDSISKVSVTLANADSYFSQIERNTGWKGATLSIRFLFFDLREGAAASEEATLFRGIANPPDEITESTFRLTFQNRLGLQRLLLPETRIQRRCGWSFPANHEQREEAIDGGARGKYSPLFRCGYSADIEGGVGNLAGGGAPYTSCNFTRGQCEQRGMFAADSLGRATRRFGGIQFVPPSVLVRSFGERTKHVSAAVENEARYNDFVPLVYGTAWYTPPIVFARNDGNLTRMEVLLGLGEMEGVLQVVVNGLEIPAAQPGSNMTGTGWFQVVSLGNRTGMFNADFSDREGNPQGDPYGSMALLSVVVPNRISGGSPLPKIEVLAHGLRLPQFGADGSVLGESFSNNPAWVLLDVLRRSGWRMEDIDIASFASTAAYCDTPIEVSDPNGNPVTVARFQCNLALRRRRSAADLVKGIRSGSALYLTYGSDGLLRLRPESTISVQQPTKPAGSNSNEPLNGGWPAYEFGDGPSGFSGILRRETGEPSLRLWSRSTADSPNRLSVEFQDELNEHQQDSLSLVDVEDAKLTGQEISAALGALGIPNQSQAARILKLQLAKTARGNTYVEFETSMRAVFVRPGDLITLTYQKEGLERQLFRVLRVAPGLNYRTALVTAQIHQDAWYAELGAPQTSAPEDRPGSKLPGGPPRPLAGTLLLEDGRTEFEIEERSAENTDGSATVSLAAHFTTPRRPAVSGPAIPLLSLAARVDPASGNLAGGQTLYYAVGAVDGNGEESEASFVVRATIPEGSQTNSIRLNRLSFSGPTTVFRVYRGRTPLQLYRIAEVAPTQGEFVDGGLAAAPILPPDANYDHANFYWRLELTPEHAATMVSEHTIGNETLALATDELAGATVRITRGPGAGQERTVTGNDATSVTVDERWNPTPQATSHFAIAEGTWHFGASTTASPVRFEVPNRKGATIHVSGRAANAQDGEHTYLLSPVTRWEIGGASGATLDADVPPTPVFGLFAAGQGSIEIGGIAFTNLDNTRTISTATLTLRYWNELESPPGTVLSAGVDAEAEFFDLGTAGGAQPGDAIQAGPELATVLEVLNGGLRYRLERGAFESPVSVHAAGDPVYHLSETVQVIAFPRAFFGTAASGSFSHSILMADARIAAAELFVTNSRGASDVRRASYAGTAAGGLRTLSGGQISLQIEGFLAIQTDAVPPVVVEATHAVRDIFAVVRDAPTGAPIELRLRQDDDTYCELTIPMGSNISNVVNGFGLAPLRESAQLSLDIVSAGYTEGTTPGRDLTVTIRL